MAMLELFKVKQTLNSLSELQSARSSAFTTSRWTLLMQIKLIKCMHSCGIKLISFIFDKLCLIFKHKVTN